MCKRSNAFSLPVLIARSARLLSLIHVHSTGSRPHRPAPSKRRFELKTHTFTHVHGCASPAWWFLRGAPTRSHSELGRENPLRQWYFVSRRGRVGRCQACQAHPKSFTNPSLWRCRTPVSRHSQNLVDETTNPEFDRTSGFFMFLGQSRDHP